MKALILESANNLQLKERPIPVAGKEELLLTVDLAGIGGSEHLGFSNPGIRPIPHVMGHGIVGRDNNGSLVAVYPLHGCAVCENCKNNKIQLCDEWKLIGVHSDGGLQQKIVVPENAVF